MTKEIDFKEVILVDQIDNSIGLMEKMEAHTQGLLHRAFSLFVFDFEGNMLLQRRASTKYHSANLWTNTCCSHPQPNFSMKDCVSSRLKYEMGFECPIFPIFEFIYNADLENNLVEYEYDHVFVGYFDGKPNPNPNEVCEWEYVNWEELNRKVTNNPENFTKWFKLCYKEIFPFIFQPKLI